MWALAGLAVLAVGFCLIGLPSGLRPAKVSVLGQWVARLPSFVQDLPETQNGRVSMNQLAGALLYVLPVVLGGALAPRGAARSERVRPGMRALLALLALAMAATLALAQSRAAWLGLAAGLVVLVALRWRWGRWVVLAATLAALGGWLLVGRARLEPLLVDMLNAPGGADTSWGSLSLRGRVTIWEQTIVYVGERPWAGYGLGTYRGVAGDPTAGTLIDAGLPHAHNVFLQAAYDLGLPGLAAYLAVLWLAATSCWRAYRQGDAMVRSLAAGALAALAAYHVYGLADVVALGAKPGVLWWGLLAWIAALDRLVCPQASPGERIPAG
jgi:putative inorganic carbon (HCO3(-)) transporter